MARAKKKVDELWAEYDAMQLTPEQKAAGRAELRKVAEKAAAAGVYDRLLALEGTVHIDWNLDDVREDRD